MINLAWGRSRMCIVAIVFFTCVWIPLRQLKKAVGSMIHIFSGGTYDQSLTMEARAPPCEVKLPVCGFEELPCGGEMEEICSICLVEFVGEDLVSQPPRCRHLFHPECIETWIHRNNFTCPLCRSFLFNAL